MRLLCILCLFLLFSLDGEAQKIKDYYDLEFKDFNECNWDWLSNKNNCIIYRDKFESGRTRNNVLCLKSDTRSARDLNMGFLLGKSITLPPIKHRSSTISLDIRNNTDSIVSFAVLGIDDEENIVFNKKIRIKKQPSWKKTIITCPSEKVKAIKIYIEYKGNADKGQSIYLKNLDIRLDKKSILAMDIDSFNNSNIELNPARITPLDLTDSTHLLNNIKEINGKKIIGLGESAHGSETIADAQFLFLRNLVVQYNCKLILLEIHLDLAMIYDLYVQGLISESSETVRAYLMLGVDRAPTMSFLKWLRKYNAETKRKVHVLGIDNSSIGARPIPLMDYHFELLGKEKAYPYLQKLWKNEIGDVEKISENDTNIKMILGTENYAYYRYMLSSMFRETKKLSREDIYQRYLTRDSSMALRVAFLDSLFTKPQEKIAILAHVNHLQKINELTDQQYTRLGKVLKDKYSTNYYALDFTFGSGKFNQDSCSLTVRLIEDSLKVIPKNSFEYAALKTNQKFFFYPSKYLDNNINSSLNIGRLSQNKNHFEFANLKKRFDGYVFLNKSKAFSTVERVPLGYMMRLFSAKERKYRMYFDSIQTKPK